MEPEQPQPQLEQPQNAKTISIAIVILLILAALGAGYVWSTKYRVSNEQESLPTYGAGGEPVTVVVRNTPLVDGILPVPEGFPPDIPLEDGDLTESATSQYSGENSQLLSVSYLSSRTIAEKYAEYKDYMTASGYQITEGNPNASTSAVFGVGEDANMSVVVSSAGGKTLVQISYISKTAQ